MVPNFNNTLIENAKPYNSKKIDCGYTNMTEKKLFIYTAATNIIESAILNQFKKQQIDCFYNFHQH